MNFNNTEAKVVITILLVFVFGLFLGSWFGIFALPVGGIVGWWIASRRHIK